jgi:hypothetical protein
MPLELKKGDTFSLSGPVSLQNGAGEPIDLSGWTVTCQVRFPEDESRATIAVSWLGPTTIRLFSNDTGKWLVGTAHIDLQFTSPEGIKVSTKTEKIRILEDVTLV